MATPSSPPAAKATLKARRPFFKGWRRGWKFYLLLALGIPFLILSVVTIYYYVSFSKIGRASCRERV